MAPIDRKGTTRRALLQAGGGALICGLASALPSCRVSDGDLFTCPPALFRPTDVGCTLHWIPNGEIQWRLLGGAGDRRLEQLREGRGAKATKLKLKELPPGAEFRLRLEARRDELTGWQEFPLGPTRVGRFPGESFRVALLADSHIYHGTRELLTNYGVTLAHVVDDAPDFAIFLGDEAGVYSVRDREGTSQRLADESWRTWRCESTPLLSSVPSFMVLGNHEGEAGFYRNFDRGLGVESIQKWATSARRRHFLNPGARTYAEGGEKSKPSLQNYYAFTWGDALFVVLDVHRYTGVDGAPPANVEDWTLGSQQRVWLEEVLLRSTARFKLVIAHHLVGGWSYDLSGRRRGTDYKYGRGGARYAEQGEQAWITRLMERAGAQAFLYGHDHVFSHQRHGPTSFICCGRSTRHTQSDQRWWDNPGWLEAYGDVESRPHDFHAAIGFTRLQVGPEGVSVQYVRTIKDPADNVDTRVGGVVYEAFVT